MVQMDNVLRQMAAYLDNHFKLDRYLGPSVDVSAAMMTNILTKNNWILHRSMYRVLK